MIVCGSKGWVCAGFACCVTLGAATLGFASPPCNLSDDGCVTDDDGDPVDAEAAYRDIIARDNPDWLRAAIEEALVLGAGTAWYWIDRERQVADWDFPSVKDRITFEAWRLDSNPFPINFFWHAFNGASFHLLARSNDLSLAAALGYGFATSMVWEWGLEFREKISINDVILTPIAGLTGGEFFHWLGRLLDDRGPRALHWALVPPHALHRYIDGPSLRGRRLIWHRFRLAYDYGHADIDPPSDFAGDDSGEPAAIHGLELYGRLVALPGYGRPGRQTRWFRDGNVTSMRLRAHSAGGDTAIDLVADTIPIGWLAQSRRGSAILGPGVGYHYRKETIGPWHDRVGVVHLPGPAVDADLLHGPWRLSGRLRLNVDFAGIHGLLFRRWRQAHPDPELVPKTILRKHGYYYGWGLSMRAHLELIGPSVQLGAELHYGRYDSQEDLDRAQERITADIDAGDRIFEWQAWARVKPLQAPYYLEFKAIHTGRKATLEEFSDRQSLRRYFLSLGAEL